MTPERALGITASFQCARCRQRIPGAQLFLTAAYEPVCGPCYVLDPPQEDIDGALADLEGQP